MHITVNSFNIFENEFHACGRQDQFSREALRILFNYLEQCEEDTGESIELDVVALCCDYTEMGWRDVAECYRVDLSHCDDDAEREDEIRAYLQDHTTLCGEFDEPYGVDRGGPVFVFQQF